MKLNYRHERQIATGAVSVKIPKLEFTKAGAISDKGRWF
jgi:hypothetical protein